MWTIILIVALVACVLAIFLLVNHPTEDEQLPYFAEDLSDDKGNGKGDLPIDESVKEEDENSKTV